MVRITNLLKIIRQFISITKAADCYKFFSCKLKVLLSEYLGTYKSIYEVYKRMLDYPKNVSLGVTEFP